MVLKQPYKEAKENDVEPDEEIYLNVMELPAKVGPGPYKTARVMWEETRFLDSQRTQDGKLSAWFIHRAGKAVFEVTFAPKPRQWCITGTKAFYNQGTPVVYTDVELEDLEDWPLKKESVAHWRETRDQQIVPARAIFWKKEVQHGIEMRETEFLYSWRLGEDVHTQLLDPKRFTSEFIPQDADFDEMLQLIEEERERLRKQR